MRRNLKVLVGLLAVVTGLFALASPAHAVDTGEFEWLHTWAPTEENFQLQEDLAALNAPVSDGGGDFTFPEECDVDLWTSCDIFEGAAPIVAATPTGTYPSGSWAYYTMDLPAGPDANLEEVSATAHVVAGESELTQETGGPVGFLAIWDGENVVDIDSRDDFGTLEVSAEGSEETTQIIFGMVTQDPQNLTENHWIGLGSVRTFYTDTVPPDVIDVEEPTGWTDENYEGIPVEAEDNGLGLVGAAIGGVKRNPAHFLDFYAAATFICPDYWLVDCPSQTPSGFVAELNPLAMKEGNSTVTLGIYNFFNNPTFIYDIPFKNDTQDPTSTLGGSFTTAPGMVLDAALYELEVDAADGNPTGVHNSGVKKIQVLVDDVEIDSDTQSCPGDDCTMELETDIEPDNWSNGEHQLKVKVTDQVGHVKTTTVDFEVDR